MKYQTLTVAMLLLLNSPLFAEQGITTSEIIQSANSQRCLDLQAVGECYWLDCDEKTCKVKVSIKIKHYIPETVVSTYSETGSSPWGEVAIMSQPIAGAEGGGTMIKTSKGRDNKVRFKNVDVIGHPAVQQFNNSGNNGICESVITPFKPYFLSTWDQLGWRWGIPEMVYPEALFAEYRQVGIPLWNVWGNIYPRHGFIAQPDDFKAAAVTMQRAADIVTRGGQPHVYLTTLGNGSDEDGYWPPSPQEPVLENMESTHKWQQLYPSAKYSCGVFPDREMTTRSSSDGYAFALWRPYQCCKKMGQALIFSTGY